MEVTTRRLGVAPLVGFEDYVVEDGRISTSTWTTTEETLQGFVAPRGRILTLAGVAVALVGVLGWSLLAR